MRVPIILTDPSKADDALTQVEYEPQLGGEGSGALPRFYVATGQAGHQVVGIDAGSRFCRAATFKNGFVQIVTEPSLPCCIVVRKDGKVYTVNNRDMLLGDDVVYCLRSLIGTDWCIDGADFKYDVADLYTRLLYTVTEVAQLQTENNISKAVITVPAAFTCSQRAMVMDMAKRAGIDVLQLMNESTAAALYHCFQPKNKEGTYLIYALGALSFAASLIVFRNGILEVKCTSGDAQRGCDNLDYALADWVIHEFERENNLIVSRDAVMMERLRQQCESVRKDLAFAAQANLFLPYVSIMGSGFGKFTTAGSLSLRMSIKRYEYAHIVSPVLELTFKHVQTVLNECNLTVDEIDYVLPVGMSTETSAVLDFLRERFPCTILPSAMEDSAAIGAALQASLLVHELRDYVVWDALSTPIGVQMPDGSCRIIVRRGTPLPITGYYQVDSDDGTVNLIVLQGDSERAGENAVLADLTINNCPPTRAVGKKIEIGFHLRADGTIEYSARHIGLGVNLHVNCRAGERAVYVNQGWRFERPIPKRKLDPARLARLARKLSLNGDKKAVFATLRQLGYDSLSIIDGTAVETLLRSLRRVKTSKKRSSDNI